MSDRIKAENDRERMLVVGQVPIVGELCPPGADLLLVPGPRGNWAP